MKNWRCFAIPVAMMFGMVAHAQGMGSMNMGKDSGGSVSLTAGIVQQYDSVKTDLEKAAEAMPEDGYSFKPMPAERDFGGWVAHVAQSQLGTCSRLAGQTPDSAAMEMLRGVASGTAATKAQLVDALKKSFDACDAAYNGLTDANAGEAVQSFRGSTSRIAALAGNTAHDNECYGSMAVYLRLKGIVPPSTADRGMMGSGMRGGMRGQGGMGGENGGGR
ncbi:MAG TPA: DinB family protein [Candidatus Aquilonibacter sp.]|nr:DinB family protein [Candidatus Aquilonibacter sp.]